MKPPKPVKVIQTKRSPPIWAVKVGARYVTGFIGKDAKDRAISFATTKHGWFELIEKPPTKRELLSRERREAATDSPS
jgi:hypothetical protein